MTGVWGTKSKDRAIGRNVRVVSIRSPLGTVSKQGVHGSEVQLQQNPLSLLTQASRLPEDILEIH